jgi:hypothetical protein
LLLPSQASLANLITSVSCCCHHKPLLLLPSQASLAASITSFFRYFFLHKPLLLLTHKPLLLLISLASLAAHLTSLSCCSPHKPLLLLTSQAFCSSPAPLCIAFCSLALVLSSFHSLADKIFCSPASLNSCSSAELRSRSPAVLRSNRILLLFFSSLDPSPHGVLYFRAPVLNIVSLSCSLALITRFIAF